MPGASLYYEVRGSGPLLLILQGGDGDAGGSAALARQLAGHYTVVTYDRRGLSRSAMDEGAPPPDIQTHAEDAHHLLDSLTGEPALVFGASIGALIGLELTARHPHQVRTLVAHEPPLLPALPYAERAEVERVLEEIDGTQRREGSKAAHREDMALLKMDFNDREPGVVLPRSSPWRASNLEFFRNYDAPASHIYSADIAALSRTAVRIVTALGRTSGEIWPCRASKRFASLAGTELIEFPGGHNGYVLHPKAFAARLCEVLMGTLGAGR